MTHWRLCLADDSYSSLTAEAGVKFAGPPGLLSTTHAQEYSVRVQCDDSGANTPRTVPAGGFVPLPEWALRETRELGVS